MCTRHRYRTARPARTTSPAGVRSQRSRNRLRGMMPPTCNVSTLVPLLALVGFAAATACAPADDTATGTSTASASAGQCAKDSLPTLKKGSTSFGTDQPAYPPWFVDDDPANGKGFESAVAYAVANKLGYANQDVTWVRVPFNAAIAPGPKTFDANLDEFSITDERKRAVDFSPYFNVTQVVVAVKSSPAAGVTTAPVAGRRRTWHQNPTVAAGRRSGHVQGRVNDADGLAAQTVRHRARKGPCSNFDAIGHSAAKYVATSSIVPIINGHGGLTCRQKTLRTLRSQTTSVGTVATNRS